MGLASLEVAGVCPSNVHSKKVVGTLEVIILVKLVIPPSQSKVSVAKKSIC
jgi:hypothetical protein